MKMPFISERKFTTNFNQLKSDLISRKAAIDALDKLCDCICEYSKKQRHTMCGACNLGSAFDVIDELPTAEPRKGKWISHEGYEECSQCGKFTVCYSKFCPNCGARMEESE